MPPTHLKGLKKLQRSKLAIIETKVDLTCQLWQMLVIYQALLLYFDNTRNCGSAMCCLPACQSTGLPGCLICAAAFLCLPAVCPFICVWLLSIRICSYLLLKALLLPLEFCIIICSTTEEQHTFCTTCNALLSKHLSAISYSGSVPPDFCKTYPEARFCRSQMEQCV